jgi:hypothetical protein
MQKIIVNEESCNDVFSEVCKPYLVALFLE